MCKNASAEALAEASAEAEMSWVYSASASAEAGKYPLRGNPRLNLNWSNAKFEGKSQSRLLLSGYTLNDLSHCTGRATQPLIPVIK